MPNYEPPPTYADVVIVDEVAKRDRFNPVWLKWFLDLATTLGNLGADLNGVDHNSLGNQQGGSATERYHLTSAQHTSLLALPTLAAGTYTPTRSAESNLDSNVTATEAQYLRLGATVTVSGQFTADPTAAGAASFELTLPVASNLGAVEDLAGVAFAAGVAGQGAAILGSVANNTAVVSWTAADTTSKAWSYTFTYQVI